MITRNCGAKLTIVPLKNKIYEYICIHKNSHTLSCLGVFFAVVSMMSENRGTAVFRRRHAHALAKDATEIEGVLIATAAGDLADRQICGDQQFGGAAYADSREIFHRGYAHVMHEVICKADVRHTFTRCEGGDGNAITIVFV